VSATEAAPGEVTGCATPAWRSDAEGRLVAEAERLARRLWEDAEAGARSGERRRTRRIARLLDDPVGRQFVLALTDEVMRIGDPARAARHLRALVDALGRPAFLGPLDRVALDAGAALANAAPALVMPVVRARVGVELAGFVRPAEPRVLGRYIARRRREGTRVNLNLLGEAILGDDEARRRLDALCDLLARPDVDYVSVKISSVCAQINPVAFDDEVERIAAALRRLYEVARRRRPASLVNLDMEEYRDLRLTTAVLRRVLDEPGFDALDAGIVLQAYLPESLPALEELLVWADERHRRRGGRLKIRLVKGANLAMEHVVAELAGWEPAPLASKAEVDANYKRLLDLALRPANAAAIRLGVATHNVFEAAWALSLAEHRGLAGMVELEMLEGMAPSMAAAVRRQAGGVLFYSPIAPRADHESVIAYLVRRFEENTGPDNFLRHQFDLHPGTALWESEADRFRASVAASHAPPPRARWTQDRDAEERRGPEPVEDRAPFANTVDTDFSLPANRAWVLRHLGTPLGEVLPAVIPAVVAGRCVGPGQEPRRTRPGAARGDLGEPGGAGTGVVEGNDPAEPERAAYRWWAATPALVDEAVAASKAAGARWRARPGDERRRVLRRVGAELEARRGLLIGVMAADAGKLTVEGDTEVSEAVDFAYYYAGCSETLEAAEAGGLRFEPYGTVAVIPPWNFPLAIPAGGVSAALAAGNAVILKPAPETVATAWVLAEACWAAGVPQDLLQFLPCTDADAARRCVTHPGVDAVVLTGAWETATVFRRWRPDLALHAETSGKNSIVVTATADLDAAVADVVRSAFGHAGQKCSAASLVIVEAGVHDEGRFLRRLADATRSLRPGPGSDPRTTIGPLIRPPAGPLAAAFGRLDPGESWLVEPHQVGTNPHLWSPGIKLGVRPGSTFHRSECFGPLLGVMRAADLDEAIGLQNATDFGLTAGLHALDPAEIATWRERVEAGNLYVNRHITGAVVRRQPFGGWRRSVVGPGAKAGGPDYVASLGRWHAPPADPATVLGGVGAALVGELAPADPSGLAAEANTLRYLPLRRVLLRVGDGVADTDLAVALGVADRLGVGVEVSAGCHRPDAPACRVETDEALVARIRNGAVPAVDKLRLLGGVSDELRVAAHEAGSWVDDTAVVCHGALEARRWLREQAVSETRHRHGAISGRHPGLLGRPVTGEATSR